MYIVEVIPLTVLPPQVPQILSYFFNQALPRGAVVEIAIQNKKSQAVVISSAPLEQHKGTLKKSAFQLKQLTGVVTEEPQVNQHQFEIALWLSKNYYAPLGLCLKTVLPPFFTKRGYIITPHPSVEEVTPDERSTPLPIFISVGAKQTVVTLEPFIKDAIKKGGQVLLITADVTTLDYLYQALKDLYPSARLTSGTPNKEYFEVWKTVADGSCKLICATRVGLFLPFRNLWTLIVDDPLHEAYKSEMSPRYNVPDAALHIARQHGAQAIFTSPLPSLNIAYAIEQKSFIHQDKRVPDPSGVEVIDIGYERKTGNFSLFSRKLQEKLFTALQHKERVLILSGRRGHSAILVCQVCGTFTRCSNCDVPMRVHVTSESMLVCYHCGAYQNLPKSCSNCHSTKLSPAGTAGSQKIEEQLKKLLQGWQLETPIFILDSDLIRTDEQERELLAEINKTESPMIISTQMIFSHRFVMTFDRIGIINADSLMSSPDFRSEERFFYLFERLKDFQPKELLLQTYTPEGAAVQLAVKGDYLTFYKQEEVARKLLGYPPFTRLVKLTYSHTQESKAAYAARLLNEKLKMAIAQYHYEDAVAVVGPSPSFIAREQGKFKFSIILKIKRDFESLSDILRFVPTQWQIDVDPRQIQ